MELKGRTVTLLQIPGTDKGIVQFEVENIYNATREWEKLKDKDLRIIAKQWRDRRTLDMNAYYWVLLTKLAEVLHSTPDELHLKSIYDHQIIWTDEEDKVFQITVKSEHDPNKATDGIYWKRGSTSSDGKWTAWYRIKGTSDCDKQEMSLFLDDLIEECKEQGIETATPEELAKIKALGI